MDTSIAKPMDQPVSCAVARDIPVVAPLASDANSSFETPSLESVSAALVGTDNKGICGRRASRIRRAAVILLADLSSVVAAAALGWALYCTFGLESVWPVDALVALAAPELLSLIALPIVIIVGFSAAAGHYQRFNPFWSEMSDYLRIALYALVAGVCAQFVVDNPHPWLWFTAFWAVLLGLLPLSRAWAKRQLMARGQWYRPTLIVGAVEGASSSKSALEGDPYLGQKVVGFVSSEMTDSRDAAQRAQLCRFTASVIDRLECRYGQVEILCTPQPGSGLETFRDLIDDWLPRSNSIIFAPPANGLPLYGATTTRMFAGDSVLLHLKSNMSNLWIKGLKRTFDVVTSLVLLALLAPLFLLLSILVKADGGPLLYGSKRIGRGGQVFSCLKFRSMVPRANDVLEQHLRDNPGARSEWADYFKLRHDPRVTRFGRFIRKYSLDELPQLINVLKGDMSLVGPRPILPEEVESYGDDLKLYHMTRPGITGLWQVCGRSDLDQTQRVQLNAWYARNCSIWTDVVIMLKTIPTTFRGSGAV